MAKYTMDKGPTRDGCPYRCQFNWDVMSICPDCRRFRIAAIQEHARAAKTQKDRKDG